MVESDLPYVQAEQASLALFCGHPQETLDPRIRASLSSQLSKQPPRSHPPRGFYADRELASQLKDTSLGKSPLAITVNRSQAALVWREMRPHS